jgi:hypothetical protein
VRNPYRSRRDQRQDSHSGTRNVAGVGEFRAVAERLLETGAQYLEQGREWLHAATRRERAEDQHDAAGPHAPSGGREPGADRWRESAPHAGERTGPGAGFSGSGTARGGSGHAGHDYDDHRARDFDLQAEQLVRGRGRSGGYGSETWRGQRDHGHHGSRDDDWYLPGSYGFGGEGRHEPGAPAEAADHHRRWRGGGFQEASGRWEQAYQAQGQGSHRGRGPRGYARSDERILEEVNERLCDDPIVDASEIEVRCEQGCVVLEGRVPTRWMKHRAEDIADSASGVKDVDNRIRVIAEEPTAQGDFDTRRTGGASASPPGSTSTAGATSTGTGAAASSGTGASPFTAASGKTPGSGSQENASSNDTTPPQPQAPH